MRVPVPPESWLAVVNLLNFQHADSHVVVTHRGLKVHFSDDKLHIASSCPYFQKHIVDEVSLQILCLVLKIELFLPYYCILRLLSIFQIYLDKVLHQVYTLQTFFSQSMACLFIHLTVSAAERKLLLFTKCILSVAFHGSYF